MLIIPIKKNNRIYNLVLGLNWHEKSLSNKKSGQVDVAGRTMNLDEINIHTLDWLRHNGVNLEKKVYKVTSKISTANTINLYELPIPKDKVDSSLEKLYVSGLLDLIKNEANSKGKIISLKKFGLFEDINENKIEIIKQVTSNITSESRIKQMLEEYGISKIYERYEYFTNEFNLTDLDSSLEVDSLEQMLEFTKITNSKLSKELEKYKEAVSSNTEIIKKILIIGKSIKGKQLITKEKRFVKERLYEKNAA